MSTPQHTVLVVDDEVQLLRMLQSALLQAGYEVLTASSALGALEHLIKRDVNLILLDLGLPDADGKDVITRSRSVSTAPVIVISARHSEKEKIAALDLGASDYLAKPFDMGELLARMRVALRPVVGTVQSGAGAENAEGRLVIDYDTRRVLVDGRAARLSRKEADLVKLLVTAAGAVVPHDKIIEQIWGADAKADQMNLRVLAWQVRRKIEPNAAVPRYLISEAGAGYRLKVD
jgi:two-component system KDP operon response regulator KdpE